MLMLLAAAQVDRLVVAVLDMQSDGVFVKLAACIQIRHVKHGVAAPDDIERWIEDRLRHGHAMSSIRFQLVSLALICISKDSANLLSAKTGSRCSDKRRKMCSPAFLRVARSRRIASGCLLLGQRTSLINLAKVRAARSWNSGVDTR